MKSMTGFGHSEGRVENFEIDIDIKTVNSRYFDFKPKLPRELSSLEGRLRQETQRVLKRGRIDFFIELKPITGGQLEINHAMVDSYIQVAEELSAKGVGGNLNVYNLINLPGVLVPTVQEITSENFLEDFLVLVREAIRTVDAARTVEGQSLRADLEEKLDSVEKTLPEIESRLENINEMFEARLTRKMEELARDLKIDQQRIAQELVYYLEKSDISEELTRLKSHVRQFRSLIVGEEGEVLGKNLDFLCQEMNREANTILAKSPLSEVTDAAVLIKGEIERMREQVQNVE